MIFSNINLLLSSFMSRTDSKWKCRLFVDIWYHTEYFSGLIEQRQQISVCSKPLQVIFFSTSCMHSICRTNQIKYLDQFYYHLMWNLILNDMLQAVRTKSHEEQLIGIIKKSVKIITKAEEVFKILKHCTTWNTSSRQ